MCSAMVRDFPSRCLHLPQLVVSQGSSGRNDCRYRYCPMGIEDRLFYGVICKRSIIDNERHDRIRLTEVRRRLRSVGGAKRQRWLWWPLVHGASVSHCCSNIRASGERNPDEEESLLHDA